MPFAAWVTVKVVDPIPTIVMVEPETVATAVLLEVYVSAPLLGEVGAVIVGAVAPYATLEALRAKPLSAGVPRLIVSDVDVEADL